jgi:hypothetical protein
MKATPRGLEQPEEHQPEEYLDEVAIDVAGKIETSFAGKKYFGICVD